MANTYTQVVIHAIFVVQGRANLITQNYRDDLHKFLSHQLSENKAFPYAVNGWLDHVHVLFEMPTTVTLAKLIGDLKAYSSAYINRRGWVKGRFSWQSGFAAFSCSKEHRDNAIKYIINQEAHHRGTSFKTEYLDILQELGVPFDERYVFEFIDL